MASIGELAKKPRRTRSIRLRGAHAHRRASRAPARPAEVLIAFAQPYTALVAKHDLPRYESTLQLAAVLWNASLAADDALGDFVPRIAAACECDAETALEMIVLARKRRLERFPGERRTILRLRATVEGGLVRVEVETAPPAP